MAVLYYVKREFDTVIILDANNSIWPLGKAENDGRLEEELRLFSVSVSCAKNNLLIFVCDQIQSKM